MPDLRASESSALPRVASPGQRRRTALDTAERLLESNGVRVVLSLLIFFSVLLPELGQHAPTLSALAEPLDPFFLTVFGLELLIRLVVYWRKWSHRRANASEMLLLVFDLVAVLSFLPLEGMVDSHYLRLLRLARLLLLFGYWGRMARDLLIVLSGPERRYQVIGVLCLGAGLSFCSTVLVRQLSPNFDFDGDGDIDNADRGFFRILWWSFHQVQDGGYLVNELDQPLIVVVSLLLTFSGILLLSLVIGIGTGAIEEVLVRAREQPLALHDHTVVLGLTPHSAFLLEGLARIYRKNLRPFRAAVLGPTPEVPAYLHRPLLRAFQYRSGDPVRAADLERVNIRRAKRVLILGSDPRHPDGEVISALLATRERNVDVDVYPDVEHEKNFRAVLSAGGPGTHLVGSGSFLGHYIVHNVVYPGAYHVYRHLLRSSGSEIYTYFFSSEEREQLLGQDPALSPTSFDPAALQRLAYRRFGVTMIGLFVNGSGASEDVDLPLEIGDLRVVLNPTRTALDARPSDKRIEKHLTGVFEENGKVCWSGVRGLAGISLRWVGLRRLSQTLVESSSSGLPTTSASASIPETAATAETSEFASLDLRPACSPTRRVLISGGSLRVPRVVIELSDFYPGLEVTVLVENTRRLRRIVRGVQTALTESGRQLKLKEWDHGAELVARGPEAEVQETLHHGDLRVSFLEAHWTDSERLRQAGAVDLESADAVLLLPGASRIEELDGAVALDCLHLANLVRSGDLVPRAGLHVLGMVRDAVKGDLLESRLQTIAGADSVIRFTVISSERARHHYIMQNVFVRGLNPLYLQLLNAEGQHLSRLRVSGPAGRPPVGEFDPAELGEYLLAQRQMVFVGLELEDEAGGCRIELDPHQMPPGKSISWPSVRAIFALGAWQDLAAQ